MLCIKATIAVLAFGVVCTTAETHSVVFTNKCGHGTPMLIQAGRVLSAGAEFTINGPLVDAIAFLQTGNCGALTGAECAVVETTLRNPTSPTGNGSITDISFIPPHTFSGSIGFAYFNGCDGMGVDCANPNCLTGPFKKPVEAGLQVSCQQNNVSLAITFCD